MQKTLVWCVFCCVSCRRQLWDVSLVMTTAVCHAEDTCVMCILLHSSCLSHKMWLWNVSWIMTTVMCHAECYVFWVMTKAMCHAEDSCGMWPAIHYHSNDSWSWPPPLSPLGPVQCSVRTWTDFNTLTSPSTQPTSAWHWTNWYLLICDLFSEVQDILFIFL